LRAEELAVPGDGGWPRSETGWLVPGRRFTDGSHAIAVRGRWSWILSAYQYGHDSAGTCPFREGVRALAESSVVRLATR
jgi:hypothetical protein